MKHKMISIQIAALLLLVSILTLVNMGFVQEAKAQGVPTCRYTEILDMEISGNQIKFTVSFAIYAVERWGDRCNLRLWIIKDSGVFLAGWGVGFNNEPVSYTHLTLPTKA